ncbi:hypothetical protein FNV43_RR05942 [Rhamnella rubrinervis]|uniref:Uncharacterized protein n=1 Tax=Rhamnella rubrinervis TaxID=2594499 RepID=A0A8K0HDL5_9ROSA|nr:hypothetical protein FNV43_RR05942 [Rhamnella rubrinervis]
MEKKDDHGDGVVDVRTGATNLHKQINAMEYQIQNARATLEQLQEEQLVVKKNFNRLLEEFSHGGDGSTANLENELGFKISQVPGVIGKKEKLGRKLQENTKTVMEWLRVKDPQESKEVEDHAAEMGTQLSFSVIRLLLFMLQRRELVQNGEFQRFKALIACNKSSTIASKICTVIEIVEAEFTKKKAVDLEQGIMSPENAEDVAYEASIKRREINQVFQKVVNQILHLESIGSSISCPEEWLIVAKDLAMSLENRLVDYKKGLYEINEKIRELADEYFPYWIEAEEEKVKEFSYRINTQVYGLWVVNDDDDSEEASKQASKRRKGSDYR